MKIRVARIFDYWDGNPNYYLFDIMRMLDKDKFSQIIIFLSKKSRDPNPLEEEGFKCYYLSKKRGLFKSFRSAWELRNILKKEKIDIAHCNRRKAAFYASIASHFYRIKVILCHIHALGNCKRGSARKRAYRFISNHITGYIACADAIAKDILDTYPGANPQNVITLLNSINVCTYQNAIADKESLRKKYNVPSGHFLFIAVGRLCWEKDHETLIRAFFQVLKKNTDVTLIIWGEGEFRKKTESVIADLGLKESVFLPGASKEIPAWLKSGNAYVMSSVSEAMPLALMEAMAAGIPCVATRIGGIPEIIPDERYGFLVLPKDIDGMANAMMRVMNMPKEQRELLIKAAQDRIVTEFNHETAVKKQEALYRRLIKESDQNK